MHALIFTTLLMAAANLREQALEVSRPGAWAPAAAQDPAADPKAEYETRKKEAEGNLERLWSLYEWCDKHALKTESRSTLRAILKLDASNAQAHKLLGHVEFEGKWYDSEKKVEEFKRKQLEAEAKATGKVIYKGALVDPADLPFLQKGWTKDAAGKWVDLESQKKIAEGWVRQDLTWIAPAEAENIAKGLWKCGDKWLSLDEANEYHSEVENWWTITNPRFVLYSTCTRKVSEQALLECERAFKDLVRIYGKTPAQALPVVVLNTRDQYGRFARGETDIQTPEARPLSSIHGAFMADALAAFTSAGGTLPGVAYWDDSSEKERSFGPMYLRHAAGQSYAEALDPSPKALAKLLKGDMDSANSYADDFWAEKQLPEWFRFGAAAYVERYQVNSLVKAGGNPNETREWSVTNITNKGGLDPFDKIFKFEIGVDNQNSGKLINEAGLMVAFVLDGKCVEVIAKLGALKEALRTNKEVSKAGLALAEEIKKNEAKLRQFAQL